LRNQVTSVGFQPTLFYFFATLLIFTLECILVSIEQKRITLQKFLNKYFFNARFNIDYQKANHSSEMYFISFTFSFKHIMQPPLTVLSNQNFMEVL